MFRAERPFVGKLVGLRSKRRSSPGLYFQVVLLLLAISHSEVDEWTGDEC